MTVKSLLLASTALLLVAGNALADQRHIKKPAADPPPPPRSYSWSGCYVGGDLGLGWSRTNISEPPEPAAFGAQHFAPLGTSIAVNPHAAALGGPEIGCDHEFANNWVIGAAGDFSWAHISGQTADPFFVGKFIPTILVSAKIDWLASATARVGYAWDRLLFYGKGGAAWTRETYTVSNLGSWGNPVTQFCSFPGCSPTATETRAGWTLGLGLEWAFAPAWSAGVEYDHYGFGSHNVVLVQANTVAGTPASGPVSVRDDIDVVKLKLNYRFSWAGLP
jgi:outer membrane immunogenic protein